MIEGRVQADGTLEVGPHTARPEVIRQLLVLSIGLASLGTLAGGVMAVDELSPGNTPLFTAAGGQISSSTDISLLAAGVSPAELADLDTTVEVIVTEPVMAVIDRTPVGKAQPVGPVVDAAQNPVTTVTTVVAKPPPPTTIPSATQPAQAPTSTSAPTTSTTTPASGQGSATVPASTSANEEPREYTTDEVKAIIAEVFGPAEGTNAIAVANCESHLNPRAISKGGGNWGLFQINQVHKQRVARMGFAWDDLLDPRVNSLVAKSIFDDGGWGPWACKP